MAQASMSELLQRMRMLEAQIQTLQQQLQQVQGQPAAEQACYGDLRMAGAVTPAGPEIARQEAAKAAGIDAAARQAAQDTQAIPDFDPYAWGELKPGQSHAARRQEIHQIQERRQARKQAEQDQQVLNKSGMDIDLPPMPDPVEAATAFANERRTRMAQGAQLPPPTRPEPPQRAPEASPQGNPPRPAQQPLPPPYIPKPDTNTQIPQPPDWKDSPERLTRGPVNQQPQQQTFGQAQATFDAAVARQMEMIVGFVQDATRRIEELECWREAFCQE